MSYRARIVDGPFAGQSVRYEVLPSHRIDMEEVYEPPRGLGRARVIRRASYRLESDGRTLFYREEAHP